MKKKVYELAKEMGIQSKDLIAKAGALGSKEPYECLNRGRH